jgi:hypothetical protein
MLLAPPLWATGSWVDDSWADGTWATEITVPGVLDDLTFLFVHYVEDLRDAHPLAVDSNTLVRNDLATVRAATGGELDDANTMYARYLS